MKRVVSVWFGTLPDAHAFVREHALEQFFVQFLCDGRGYWVVLNILSNVWIAVKSVPRAPRLTVLE